MTVKAHESSTCWISQVTRVKPTASTVTLWFDPAQVTPERLKERLEGADAMHAWVSVWAGPEVGWVDIDPTNALLVDDDHIRIAVGREYADVAPIDGVIVVSGEQTHTVAVDVIPLD